jgi:hypothetical protein
MLKSIPANTDVREVALSKNDNAQFVKPSVQQLFELFTTTLFGKDTFYEAEYTKLTRVRSAIKDVLRDHGLEGAEYISNVILFARKSMNMRTMPIAMTVELASALRDMGIDTSFSKRLRELTGQVISRADELCELYAYALTIFGGRGKLPIAMRKGVADAFNKFDAYQLAKYNSGYKAVSMKAVLRDVHPVPHNNIQSKIYKQIMAGVLPPANTWDLALTQNGMLPPGLRKSPKEIWTELALRSGPGEVGYMALIRNLRNIVEAQCSYPVIAHVANRIKDKSEVTRSKQLPWAFINAFDAGVQANFPGTLQFAITKACDLALDNIPKLGENVWIILDSSKSMMSKPGGGLVPIQIASLFASAIYRASSSSKNVALTSFSTDAKHIFVNRSMCEHLSVIELNKYILNQVEGGGTNLDGALKLKGTLGFEPDTVIILSDMELSPFMGPHRPNVWNQVMKIDPVINNIFAPSCLKIAMNFNSSETTVLDPRDGWHQLVGWSENIFKYVDFSRTGRDIITTLLPKSLKLDSPTKVAKAKPAKAKAKTRTTKEAKPKLDKVLKTVTAFNEIDDNLNSTDKLVISMLKGVKSSAVHRKPLESGVYPRMLGDRMILSYFDKRKKTWGLDTVIGDQPLSKAIANTAHVKALSKSVLNLPWKNKELTSLFRSA